MLQHSLEALLGMMNMQKLLNSSLCLLKRTCYESKKTKKEHINTLKYSHIALGVKKIAKTTKYLYWLLIPLAKVICRNKIYNKRTWDVS